MLSFPTFAPFPTIKPFISNFPSFRPTFNFSQLRMPAMFKQMQDETSFTPKSYNGSLNSNYASDDGDNFIPKFLLNGTPGDRETILQLLKVAVPENLMPLDILDDPKFNKGNLSLNIETSNEEFKLTYQFVLSDQLIQVLEKRRESGVSHVQQIGPNLMMQGNIMLGKKDNQSQENLSGESDKSTESETSEQSDESTSSENRSEKSSESSESSYEDASQSDESDELFEKYLQQIKAIGKKYLKKIKAQVNE